MSSISSVKELVQEELWKGGLKPSKRSLTGKVFFYAGPPDWKKVSMRGRKNRGESTTRKRLEAIGVLYVTTPEENSKGGKLLEKGGTACCTSWRVRSIRGGKKENRDAIVPLESVSGRLLSVCGKGEP